MLLVAVHGGKPKICHKNMMDSVAENCGRHGRQNIYIYIHTHTHININKTININKKLKKQWIAFK